MWQNLAVHLSATPTRGKAPLTVELSANGEGFACGCCGGRKPTQVVSYSWDLDENGLFEEGGPALTTRRLVLEKPGKRNVTVAVQDSAGERASASALLVAEDAATRDSGTDGSH